MFQLFPKRDLARVCLFGMLALGAMSPAFADTVPQAPSEPGGLIPQWESPFSEYQAFEAQPVLSWQGVNRRVAEIGGWRTYAMEPYEDDAAEGDPSGDQSSDQQTDDANHDAHAGGHP